MEHDNESNEDGVGNKRPPAKTWWTFLSARLAQEKISPKAAGQIEDIVCAIVRAETEALQKQLNEATTLMMRGEQLRDSMKLHAILNGAYDHLVKK
jgi:hypothetical protein